MTGGSRDDRARFLAALFLFRDVGRDAGLLAREPDVENARLVAQRVAMDAEGVRGAAEVSGGALHRSHDVFLLELFLREVQRDSVREKLIDDLLKLSIEIHVRPPLAFSKMERAS